jgi:hypothetical protein
MFKFLIGGENNDLDPSFWKIMVGIILIVIICVSIYVVAYTNIIFKSSPSTEPKSKPTTNVSNVSSEQETQQEESTQSTTMKTILNKIMSSNIPSLASITTKDDAIIGEGQVNSSLECALLCESNPQANSWTYNSTNKICKLRSTQLQNNNVKLENGVHSGIKGSNPTYIYDSTTTKYFKLNINTNKWDEVIPNK